MTNNQHFSGESLRFARVLNGFTQQELGDLVSASRQFINQLESDNRTPSTEFREVLIEALNVTDDFLSRPTGNNIKSEQCHFRKRKTTPRKVEEKVLAYSTIFENLALFINSIYELPDSKLPEPPEHSNSYSELQVIEAAASLRASWGVQENEPIPNLCRLIENHGILITHFDQVPDKVDALSINRHYPIIVRNVAKESICRMRFDLAHELGHFVLHDGIETGDVITENEAIKFASAFLLPPRIFRLRFGEHQKKRLDWQTIYQIKVDFGISVRAIIYTAHKMGLITAAQNRSANIRLNRSGQTKIEQRDEDVFKEKPELISDLFESMQSDMKISFGYIADKLAITEKMLTIITGYKPSADISSNIVPLLPKNQ